MDFITGLRPSACHTMCVSRLLTALDFGTCSLWWPYTPSRCCLLRISHTCISGLLMLPPPTAHCQNQINSAQKHTEGLYVLSVWTGRGFPGCLEIISWLNYICVCVCLKKQIGFFTVSSSPPPYFLLWKKKSSAFF